MYYVEKMYFSVIMLINCASKCCTTHSCQTALLLGGRPVMPFFCPAFWTLPCEALHLPFLLGFLEIYQSYTISDCDFSEIYQKKRSPLL